MSMHTGDQHVDEVVQGLVAGFQQLMRHARGLVRRFRQLINRQQRTRMMMEHWTRQGQWDPNVRAQRQQLPGPERTQAPDRAAQLAAQVDALQADVNARDARIQNLQQQADQTRQDRDAADAQQRASDEYRNRTDGNDNGIDDNQDADNRLADQNQQNQDQQQTDRREAQQTREDDDRRKREEDQERKGREEADTGVGPGEVTGAAAGAAIAAEEIDEQLDKQDAQNDAENATTDAEQQTQADSEQQTQADNEQQTRADSEQGVDANATNDPERNPATDPAIDPEQQTDAENAAPGVDQQTDAEVENAAADPSQVAGNQLEADAAEQGASPYAADAADLGQQQESQAAQQGGSTIAVGQGGVENGQQKVVDWNTERDGPHIDATDADPNTVYRIPEGQSVSLEVRGGADQDSPGMDMRDVGRDAADSNRESINIGDISGDNQTFVVDQDGVHQGVQEGDTTVARAGQQEEQGQQPRETLEQPAFPTAGDAAAANRVEEQSMEDTQQGGQNAQQAAQVAGRDAQEKPVLDGLRAENAENRAKNPPGRAQAEMSPEEIDQQQQKVNAGLPSAAGAPGYDAGEPATAGASGGREYADRARQGNRGPDRGNDGRGMGE